MIVEELCSLNRPRRSFEDQAAILLRERWGHLLDGAYQILGVVRIDLDVKIEIPSRSRAVKSGPTHAREYRNKMRSDPALVN